MLNLCRVVFFLVCTALAACGGGGGSSGAVPNAGDLRTTAGGAVSMAVGSVQSYDVQGGVPPYRLGGNTAPELVMASVNGSVLIIRTVSAGSVVVTVLDNSGKSVVIRVNAGASTPLTTNVPSPLQIASAATISSFTVSGGRAPYSVVSSDGNIARGSISGSMFSITGVAIGSTTLNILDSDGSTVSVTVNVGSSTPLNTTVPSPLQLANESTVGNFSVFGGRAPYSVVSSDANIARGSISGSALSITGVAIGSTTLTIRDSDGLAVSVTVNVGSSTPLSTTLPSPLQLANGTTINDFKVSGGRAPYSVVSSDISIVRASITGSALSVTGVGIGSTVLTIRDSDGLITRATVNVGAAAQLFWNAPADLTLQPGLSQTYLISGGSVPYRITSSAPAVASSDEIVGTTVRINAHKVGAATFRLTDAQGSEKFLEVNVVADGSGAVVSAAPQLRNAALSSSDGSIAASGPTTLSVTLTDPSGRGIANQLINFKDESADGKLTFPEGTTALTNASGVASIKVARSSLTAVGAGSVSISYNYRAGALTTYPDGSRPPAVDTLVSTFVGYQLATANVTLTNLRVLGATGLPLSLAAYGTSQVTVQANLNGTPSATPVQVNFAATCGQISPAVASTNSAGIATASYSATDAAGTTVSTLGCSDKTVEISASTTGALPSTQALNITGAAATNMSFVDASPARIYWATSGGGTQSIGRF